MAYASEPWSELYVAMAGAAAALLGLLFVAVSINLEQVLRIAWLPLRAGETLGVLVALLTTAVFVLVPGQSPTALGLELAGTGLGLITLGCLVGSTVLAAALVRRRDLLSVVVAPPMVFVAVACANIALAPSASFNLATMATLLVRGFPTMAIATGAAFVIALIRWAARR